MFQFFCDALARLRVVWSALSQVVRLVVVLSVLVVADIAYPDFDRTISGASASTHTVTYDAQGGNAVSPVSWTIGSSLTLPTPTRPGYTFRGWSTRAAGSQLVYQLTAPTRSGNNLVYTSGFGRGGGDAAATLTSQGASFDRVRYRMEANYNGTLRWADVAFDKWVSNLTLAQLAVPDLSDIRVIKTNVTNMSVASNWPGFAGTASTVTTGFNKSGRLEIWPRNYSWGTTGISPAGSASIYDNDDTSELTGDYGSFQVHNLSDSQTVLAWNRHYDSNPDIGFGNYLGSVHTDWTFAQRTLFDTATWRLQIFIGEEMPAGTTYVPSATGPFTLFAQWTPNTYSVSYNYNNATGGNGTASATYTSGNPALTLPTPTRTNFAFEGWYSDSNFTTFVGSGGASYTPTSSGTLFAKWMTNQSAFSITNSPATLGYQNTVTLGTSGGSGTGGVVFATTSPSVCSVNANTGVVTMIASSGTCNIAATKAADNTFYATSATVVISGIKASQTPLAISGTSTATFGATVSLSASGGTTANAVTWSAGSSTACSVNSAGSVSITSGSGTCAITASMSGNDNYEPVTSSSFGITVSRASQSSLTVTTTEAVFGEPLTLSVSGGSGTGALTWDKVSGVCTLSGSTLTPGAVGSACVVKATRAADANYSARSSVDTAITTVRAPQTGFSITSGATFETGSTLTLTATGGQSGGAVSWAVVSGPCTVSGNVLSSTRGGVSCGVTATRASSANYLAVTDSMTISVTKIIQTLSFQSMPASTAVVGSTVTITINSSAFLAATIAVSNQSQSVCSVSAGVVTFLAAGTCLVSVSQSGDDSYTSAALSHTITVSAAPVATTLPVVPVNTQAPSNTVARDVASPSTVAPPNRAPSAPSTSSTTTTTTTTIAPANPGVVQLGADGKVLDLAAGQSTAFVRGRQVTVNVRRVKETVVYSLPNKVQVVFGRISPSSKSAAVASDGVLRAFHQETIDVSASGLVPGSTYTLYMFSSPIELGRGVVNPDGTVTITVTVPEEVEIGEHTLQINGVGPDKELVSLSMGIEVLERESNVRLLVLVMSAAILLALLGGRPLFARRRRRRA